MTTLQIVWFGLIGFLFCGYAILDGFDLGVGFWHLFAKEESHKRQLLKAIGPVWDGNEVWLLTAGGALFAAFPPAYASVFSGMYVPLLLVLVALIVRAVAIEFRHQSDHPTWTKFWDIAFGVSSIVPAVLFGVALGNVFFGMELNAHGDYLGSFFGLLGPYALVFGLAGFLLFALHGAIYIQLKTTGDLHDKAKKWAKFIWSSAFVFYFLSGIFLYKHTGEYWVLGFCLVGALCLIAILVFQKKNMPEKAFVASCLTFVISFAAIFAVMFPNIVPASNDPSLSLTIYNASASQNTLTAMLLLAVIGMPIVLLYTWFVYKTFWGKVDTDSAGY